MPDKLGIFSIKELISEIKLVGIKPIYVLIGSDAYLQSFFINQIKNNFNGKEVQKQLYSFNEDEGDHILNEITGISLFPDPKIFILRDINKIKKSHLSDLITWSKILNPNNIVIMIKNQFDLKHYSIKELKKNFQLIDTRTPFPNKIRDWVNYILRIKNIQLSKEVIEILIENCGDSIANIDNEIEKIIISDFIDNDISSSITDSGMKDYPIYKLLDAIGRKDIKLAFKVYNNLWLNNISLPQLIFNISNFYQEILWALINQKNNDFALNYFLKKNMSIYKNKYNFEEIKNVISDIRSMDFKSKTLPISDKALMIPFLIKICDSTHESI
tara:strand:- start:431 stop:1417 length:987 start_codon:yes stop_codon:yes gene_type:complete